VAPTTLPLPGTAAAAAKAVLAEYYSYPCRYGPGGSSPSPEQRHDLDGTMGTSFNHSTESPCPNPGLVRNPQWGVDIAEGSADATNCAHRVRFLGGMPPVRMRGPGAAPHERQGGTGRWPEPIAGELPIISNQCPLPVILICPALCIFLAGAQALQAPAIAPGRGQQQQRKPPQGQAHRGDPGFVGTTPGLPRRCVLGPFCFCPFSGRVRRAVRMRKGVLPVRQLMSTRRVR
jgi:hypothetical protein